MTRTSVVTGAASGIGKATTEKPRTDGHTVVGVDIRDADVVVDLSTDEGRTALVHEVSQRAGGRIDSVIAVAGLVAASPVTVGVNYFGAKATLEGLRPLLAGSDAPRAVVVASLAALEDVDDGLYAKLLADDEPGARAEAERIGTATNAAGSSAIYSTTKKAIAHWVRTHAKDPEWAGAGIALNAIAPGVIETPMTAPALQTAEGRAALDAGAPSPLNGPAAPPAAPAALLAWLASSENTHVTGQVVFIDGGAESIRRPELV
ncbi:SDR family oxidoreductase [Curtobacterium sp. NPDC090217]|uniref:SDR family oxidoreductase n=1 Tax=Curtobacterium sp. NPDC090217 TaxID=3363970 RepID=UPI0037F8AAC9